MPSGASAFSFTIHYMTATGAAILSLFVKQNPYWNTIYSIKKT